MTEYDDIVSRLPVQQLAQQMGEDPADVERAIHTVLPALLGGLQANAADPGAAASLTQALGHHAGNLPGDGPVDLSQVDTDDGAKITRHVFGDQTDQVIDQLGGVGGVGGASSGLIAKLLPILAPIVLAYVGKQMSGSGPGGAGSGVGGGVLGSILGSILSGAASGARGGSGGSNIDLGDILGGLGGLLGGGTRG
jgi:hypothetical protein